MKLFGKQKYVNVENTDAAQEEIELIKPSHDDSDDKDAP